MTGLFWPAARMCDTPALGYNQHCYALAKPQLPESITQLNAPPIEHTMQSPNHPDVMKLTAYVNLANAKG